MSAMGMLASALGGAAGVVGQQAAGDVEQFRKNKLMQVQADMERQKLVFAEALRQTGRTADFAFENSPETVATRQATAKSNTLAAGAATREAAVAANSDTTYQASQDEAAARETQRKIDAEVQKANDPNLTAVQRKEAERKLEDLRKEVGIRADGQIRVNAAHERAKGNQGPDLATKLAGIETAIGRKLTQDEREAFAGLGKTTADPNAKAALESVLKKYETGEIKADQAGAEVKAILASLKPSAPSFPAPPPAAIADLKKSPETAAMFDSIFGPGAAAAALGRKAGDPGKTGAAPAGVTGTLKQGGMLETVRDAAAGFLDGARKEGDVVNALRQKVKDGTPLTPEEKALARKFGMMP